MQNKILGRVSFGYACLLALLALTACSGPDPEQPGAAAAPPAPQPATTLYSGARVIIGDGTVIENASFVVTGGRFAAPVGAAVELPEGATQVDLTGKPSCP